jgi:hypothetical protein
VTSFFYVDTKFASEECVLHVAKKHNWRMHTKGEPNIHSYKIENTHNLNYTTPFFNHVVLIHGALFQANICVDIQAQLFL